METRSAIGQKTESGFALLMTLIVVGVVISVGLSVLDLSIMQVRLSSNAKQSEIAFHAANAGMECARYWRREETDDIENGNNINPSCFGESTDTKNTSDPVDPGSVSGDGEAHIYNYNFSWGVTDARRCTEITMIVASTSVLGAGVTISDMQTMIPGYSYGDTTFCPAGARCTIISVEGFNKECSQTNTYGTIQREVLLEL